MEVEGKEAERHFDLRRNFHNCSNVSGFKSNDGKKVEIEWGDVDRVEFAR
jgi:hypothetical protein